LVEWGRDKSIDVSLRFTVTNHGNSPAINIRVWHPIVQHPGNPKRAELDAVQSQACVKARELASESEIGGVVDFLEETIQIEEGSGAPYTGSGLYSVLGCVDYTFGANRHGQTGFRMTLGQIINGQVYGIPFVKGPLELYQQPVSPSLLAHGYPQLPPHVAAIDPSGVYFRPEYDRGNYAK
jgi:hypothetical protein